MNQIKFNDWSELGLKKDIEQINKKIYSNEPVFFSICIEVVIAIGAIIVDHLFDTNEVPIIIWIFVSLLAISLPIFLLIRRYFEYLSKFLRAKKGVYNTAAYVDTFDNSICYWAMMCCSFCEQIKNNSDLTNEEKIFYYQEANYYINKSLYKLDEMTPIVNKVFSNDIEKLVKKHIVSIQRLDVILNLLKKISNDLNEAIKDVSGYEKYIVSQAELNDEYVKIISRFLRKMKYSCSYEFEW